MTWTLSDSGTAIFSDGGSGHVFTYAAGAPASGDLLILGVNSDATVSTPTGWNVAASDVASQGAYVFWKAAGSSEPGSVTVTTGSSVPAALSFRRYQHPAPTGTDVTVTVRDNTSGNLSPAVAPGSLSALSELCLLFAMNHSSTQTNAMTGATPSTGYTLAADTGVSGGLNAANSTQHYVLERTNGSGSQTPQVTWSGSPFSNRSSLFVSFAPLGATQTITTTGLPSVANVPSPTVNSGSTALPTSLVDGNSGHRLHHDQLHDRLNRSTQVETLTSGSTLALNAGQTGSTKVVTLTGNVTFTFTGAVLGEVSGMELVVKQDATGGRTVTWPAGLKWTAGAPTLSTNANAVDRIVVSTYDGGVTWYGDVVGLNYA